MIIEVGRDISNLSNKKAPTVAKREYLRLMSNLTRAVASMRQTEALASVIFFPRFDPSVLFKCSHHKDSKILPQSLFFSSYGPVNSGDGFRNLQ